MSNTITKLVTAAGISLMAAGASADTIKIQPVEMPDFSDIPTPQEYFKTENGQKFLDGMKDSIDAFVKGHADGEHLARKLTDTDGDLIRQLPETTVWEKPNPLAQVGAAMQRDFAKCNTGSAVDINLCGARANARWSEFMAIQFSKHITDKIVPTITDDKNLNDIWTSVTSSMAHGALSTCEAQFQSLNGVKASKRDQIDMFRGVSQTCLTRMHQAAIATGVNFYPTLTNTLANDTNCYAASQQPDAGIPCYTQNMPAFK